MGRPLPVTEARRGGYAELIREAVGEEGPSLLALDGRADLPDLGGFSGVIVTGSPASVTERAPWMLAAEARLRSAVSAGTPVLGICFGHQMLSQALGGKVEKNPRGREIGTVALRLVADDPLLDSAQDPFSVNMTHVDSVLEPPPGARVLASSALEPHAVLRLAERAWSVQFHPEIDAEVMLDYVDGRRQAILEEGLDASRIRSEVGAGEAGREVLRRFLAVVRAGPA